MQRLGPNSERKEITMAQQIAGNTYPVKEQLKAMGGRWNPDARFWTVPDERADEARKLVASAPASRRSNGGSVTKSCWECGRSFTYADAKRSGGDWQDSYCGC
jgi:hypothetical protein